MGDHSIEDNWEWLLDMKKRTKSEKGDWEWLLDMKKRTEAREDRHTEELLREKYPSLQDAWEQYQAILRLVKIENEQAG